MMASPSLSDVEGATTGDDRSTVEHVRDDGTTALRWLEAIVGPHLLTPGAPPVKQPSAAVAERIARTVVRSGDDPSSEMESPVTTLPIATSVLSEPRNRGAEDGLARYTPPIGCERWIISR